MHLLTIKEDILRCRLQHFRDQWLNLSCLAHVLDALFVDSPGRKRIDFGAGDGSVLVASLTKGACRAHGYELPANGAHQFVLNTVLKKSRDTPGVKCIGFQRISTIFQSSVQRVLCLQFLGRNSASNSGKYLEALSHLPFY